MKKKLLSLILAICMTATLLPTFALSASALDITLDEGESIGYYFYSGHSTTKSIANLSQATDYNEELGRYWRYKTIKGGTAAGSQLKGNRLNGYMKAVGNYIALEIEVPEDGTYKTEYFYYKLIAPNSDNVKKPAGGKGDVYILPEETSLTNITTATAGVEPIASVDYSPEDISQEGVVEDPVVKENVVLKKGNNILLFVGKGKGYYASSGTNYDYYATPTSLTLTLTSKASTEDEALTNAFKPEDSVATVYAPSVDAVTTVTGTSATEREDGSYMMVAPENDANGNKFLYWAKGLSLNKKIVSLEREFTYTPATGDRNYLIPVYAPQSETGNEYYNANGQLIDCAEEAPELPSMAGYGEASGWAQYEDTNIYVAEYNNKTQPDNVKVTVNGTENTVPYGTDITCTADDKDASDKPFKCWTKSNINGKTEIVSCDKNYTFKAWEDCTVTAIYEEHTYTGAKMKIIIDSFAVGNATGIMAEFIGISDAVEKGIMFGTQKIAMTKPGTQFTVTADESGTYKGYAIVEDGKGGYTLITDGSATISAAE